MGQPSDAERVIFWTKWRLMAWYSAALNQGSKVGCFTSKRLIISLCIAGLIVFAVFNVLSGPPTSEQMQDKAPLRKTGIDPEILEELGLPPVPRDQEVPVVTDELPPVLRYKDAGVLEPPGDKVQDKHGKKRDKSLNELIEEEMKENIKKVPVGQSADIARIKDKFADDHLLHRKEIRENLELMEEEKKQNQKNQVLENSEKVKVEKRKLKKKHKKKRKHTEEKEKNVDSMKLSKSFVILEEKKKLLSEKKEDEDDEEDHDLSKNNIPEVKEKINQIKKNLKSSAEETGKSRSRQKAKRNEKAEKKNNIKKEKTESKLSLLKNTRKENTTEEDVELKAVKGKLRLKPLPEINAEKSYDETNVRIMTNTKNAQKKKVIDNKFSAEQKSVLQPLNENPDVKLSNRDDAMKNPDVKLSNI